MGRITTKTRGKGLFPLGGLYVINRSLTKKGRSFRRRGKTTR